MDYEKFYTIAEYGNANWKGSFTPKEIACNAYDYKVCFDWSKENDEISFVIKELAALLAEDESEECIDWLWDMATELGLVDMDYWDFAETDSWVIKKMFETK